MRPRAIALAAAALGCAILIAPATGRADDANGGVRLMSRQLASRVNQTASAVVEEKKRKGRAAALDKVGINWGQITALAVLEGSEPERAAELPDLATYEISRFDKQVGANATSAGATNLVDRAGVPEWLAVALEHGAVAQDQSSTATTFSTSARSALALLFSDAVVGSADVLRDIGASATFPLISDSAQTVDIDHASDWSVRWQILGGRATTDRQFREAWERSIKPAAEKALGSQANFEEAVDPLPWYDAVTDSSKNEARAIAADELDHPSPDDSVTASRMASRLLVLLEETLVEPIATNQLVVGAEVRKELREESQQMKAAEESWFEARKQVAKLLRERANSRVLTIQYVDHRRAPGQDWCEGLLVYLMKVGERLDLTVNGGVSFFRDRSQVLSSQNLKSSVFSASLEGKRANPFRFGPGIPAEMPISLAARFEFPDETGKTIAIAQFRTEIPVATGVTLPFSVSWANRSELIDESEVRAHFGFTLDTDKLFALAHLAAGPHGMP